MKELTPLTKKEYPFDEDYYNNIKSTLLELKTAYKENRFRGTTIQLKQIIKPLQDQVLSYDAVTLFDKHAINVCKVRASEYCPKYFQNTLAHYSLHGNMCKVCSSKINQKIKDDSIKRKQQTYENNYI